MEKLSNLCKVTQLGNVNPEPVTSETLFLISKTYIIYIIATAYSKAFTMAPLCTWVINCVFVLLRFEYEVVTYVNIAYQPSIITSFLLNFKHMVH